MTRLETRVLQAAGPPLTAAHPVAYPIFQTSTFAFDDPAACAVALKEPGSGYAYTRHGNPTTAALEQTIADLEGGVAALATSSGMGAVNAVLLALLRPGDHVVAQGRLYGGTHRVLETLSERWGVDVTLVPDGSAEQMSQAITDRTTMIWLETIANPTTTVSNLPELAKVARQHDLIMVVDSTFATPVLCRPLEHGADIVIHSATKYLGGHDDATLGIAVFASDEVYRQVWDFTVELGVTADPFAAWLVLRGVKTLPLRVERHCENAGRLAEFLDAHPAVSRTNWPGLSSHQDHLLAKRILNGYGGVLSFEVAAGRKAAADLLSRLRCALLAPSLGGPHTLVLHPASSSHRELDDGTLAEVGISAGLVRVSVGLEHPDDIRADFEEALASRP
jgi:cystathionine beta-lyase/cystathionine gamma-synthase